MDKIICVGKNYLDHANELGDAVPEMPVLFLKPPSVLKQAKHFGDLLEATLPNARGDAHHECEIVLKLDAAGSITHVTLGLDMTLRDLQAKLKKSGHPWEAAKVFVDAALIGPWIPVADMPHYLSEVFSLTIDGNVAQQAQGTQMRIAPEACVTHAANHFPLRDGDILFTGTPAGVGPVHAGTHAELRWGQRLLFTVRWQ